jgi:lipoate-protein ligase A
MQFLDLTLPTLAENLALDEALLLHAEESRGGEVLRFWESPDPGVVLGSGCCLAADVKESACDFDRIPILRRASGGGTVLLGAGCLVYTLVLAYDRSAMLRGITSSYAFILEHLCQALADILPEITQAGTGDLAASGRKFSGNSQQRKRDYLLHHGTLLYAFDLDLVSRYLRTPSRQPEYRAGREHGAFLRNLPVGAVELRGRVRSAWRADESLLVWPQKATRQLVAAKYTRPDWIRRR